MIVGNVLVTPAEALELIDALEWAADLQLGERWCKDPAVRTAQLKRWLDLAAALETRVGGQ